MSYLHIPNLYKEQDILAFKQVYALEKIHGTSANVSWRDGDVKFFSGGENYERFVGLFDRDRLFDVFKEKFEPSIAVVVFGEAYGGKQQGMSGTYGKDLQFFS